MKPTNRMLTMLGLAALVAAGCHKSSDVPTTQQVNGVQVEMPRLLQSFSTSTNQDVRRLLVDAQMGLRYGDYVKSLMALDQLNNLPDVTPEQKKIIADVVEQEKKVAGNAPAGAAPAQ